MSPSTDLDPGYLVTHDDPAHAARELTERQAKMAALIGRVVRLGAGWNPSRVQTSARGLAVVVRTYSPDCVNVVTLDLLVPMLSLQDFALVDGPARVCPVFYRHASGMQFVALVVGVNAALQHDLLVLSDGYVDLGAGARRAGARRARDARRGASVLADGD